ncbi:MAG: hypothetical protein RIR96_828, partial [Bacteroidota bacterium]
NLGVYDELHGKLVAYFHRWQEVTVL